MTDWDAVGFVAASSSRRELVSLLHSKGHATPTRLKSASGMHMSQVSRSLGELADEGIAKCVTPSRKKGRIYTLTATGVEVAEAALG